MRRRGRMDSESLLMNFECPYGNCNTKFTTTIKKYSGKGKKMNGSSQAKCPTCGNVLDNRTGKVINVIENK
jgi:transcription elongation factor Elf1